MTQKKALEIIVRHIEEKTKLYAPVALERTNDEAISLSISSGKCTADYLCGNGLRTISLLFLAKSQDKAKPLEALEAIERSLTTLPDGIEQISLVSPPSLVDTGENGIIYEMQLDASFIVERI